MEKKAKTETMRLPTTTMTNSETERQTNIYYMYTLYSIQRRETRQLYAIHCAQYEAVAAVGYYSAVCLYS